MKEKLTCKLHNRSMEDWKLYCKKVLKPCSENIMNEIFKDNVYYHDITNPHDFCPHLKVTFENAPTCSLNGFTISRILESCMTNPGTDIGIYTIISSLGIANSTIYDVNLLTVNENEYVSYYFFFLEVAY